MILIVIIIIIIYNNNTELSANSSPNVPLWFFCTLSAFRHPLKKASGEFLNKKVS